MSMNEQLKELYQQHWDKTRDEIVIGKDSAFPFMISVSKRYENATKKVMFCGQETNCWNGKETHDYDPELVKRSTVGTITECYNDFVNKEKRMGYNSPFWNFINRLATQNANTGFIVNNIVKIGKKRRKGYNRVIDEEAHKYFPVFKEELNILKPDLIIFLTGPNYDDKIEYNLGSFSKENCLDKEEFSFLNNPANICFDKLNFNDNDIPLSYRINHPGAIQRQHQYYPMIKAIDIIIKGL